MALHLNSAIDLFHQAFDWWLAELRGMLPARIKRLFTASGPVLAVDVDNGTVVVRSRQAGDDKELGRLDITGLPPDARRAGLAALLPGAGSNTTKDAVLWLPATRVLRKTIDLPAAAGENLREVVSFDIDRQTPFSADQVYFDYAVREIDRKEGRIILDLVLAARDLVDQGVAIVRELGLVARRVTVAWPGGGGPNVNLLPRADRSSGPRLVRPLTVAFTVLAIGLAVAAVAVPLRQRHAIAEELRDRVAEQRKRAEAVNRLQTEIDQLTQQSRFLVERRATRPLAVSVLETLTSVVPDDTWLFRLRTNGDEVQIFGYSTAATALIGLIEQSPMFSDTQFRAPLTRDARTDAERLHIGFRIVEKAGS